MRSRYKNVFIRISAYLFDGKGVVINVGNALQNLQQGFTTLQQGFVALQKKNQQIQQILSGVVAAQSIAASQPVFPAEDVLLFAVPQGPEVEEREQVPRITLVKPKTFTGRRDQTERYITDTDDYFINAQVLDHRQLGIAKTFLSAPLKNWFDLRMKRGQGFADWPAVREVLRGRYKEKHEWRKARRKVLILMCKESVTDYNEDFSTLVLKIPGANELDLVDDYIEGLPPIIRYETDRAEPITLEQAMEKALDNELWLQDVSSCKGQWGRKNMPTPTVLEPINPTGPAPMELCGFGAPWRPTGLPPRHPTIPQAVWDNRRRLHHCLLCEELDHHVRQYGNGPQLPPHMQTI
uniref:Retrotransposon gag domain-containing protein n=1 Tax=Chromera velia CCMP2878 TaxID=1169474 RepID=A0A0G4IA99_9ALVE|eukprot:Cvel_12413.t1-p1 / transcript=Cvel_12413.t1 / gene=Cvel_12413 / organism=Chromera_velia_CCMP2878 / gene_product=hypothetical protein / transcript_product=hypothetical protein / location=Cvel_scaffold812:14030-16774(-) / protein_length=350 / sequence_SO=supercontig / SO=protein_coding / is_pseudo=false